MLLNRIILFYMVRPSKYSKFDFMVSSLLSLGSVTNIPLSRARWFADDYYLYSASRTQKVSESDLNSEFSFIFVTYRYTVHAVFFYIIFLVRSVFWIRIHFVLDPDPQSFSSWIRIPEGKTITGMLRHHKINLPCWRKILIISLKLLFLFLKHFFICTIKFWIRICIDILVF